MKQLLVISLFVVFSLSADPWLPAKEKELPLFAAAANGDIQLMRELIENGAEIDAETEWDWPHCGSTALSSAIKSKSVQAVKLLLSYGANPNTFRECNNLPTRNNPLLTYAISIHAPLEIIQALIDAGAQIDGVFYMYIDIALNPLGAAYHVGYRQAAELLKKAGASQQKVPIRPEAIPLPLEANRINN